MSSIHYKFKATLEYKTLEFDGLHISVPELKREICEKENIKAESFDLLLTNAHTRRQYTGDELIPRNSAVIVQRTPRDNAAKLPKVQDTSKSGIVMKAQVQEASTLGNVESEKYEKMSEEERLAVMKEVSSYKYLPSNFQKKTSSIMSGPPPPTYVCNRCSQSGHWYKNCPMLNTRRATGITMEELMETTPDDPRAMLHASGKYVVPIMHWKARQKKPDVITAEPEIREVPVELKCPLCSQILREAVLTTCCGDSFCADCVQQRLFESPNAKCPGANCFQTGVSADKLVPNLKVRQAVEAFKNSLIHGSGNARSDTGSNSPRVDDVSITQQQQQPVTRVRIGLSNLTQQTQPATAAAVIQSTSIGTSPQTQQQTTAPPVGPVTAPVGGSAPPQGIPMMSQGISPNSGPMQVPTYGQPASITSVLIPSTVPAAQFTVSQPIFQMAPVVNTARNYGNGVNPTQTGNMMANVQNSVPIAPLPINLHQPPPGYPTMPPPIARTPGSTIPHAPSVSSYSQLNLQMNAPPMFAPGLQPPPPGLSSINTFSRIHAPPGIKDAWEAFLERKDKESRNRVPSIPPRRRRRSTRSSSYSSSSSSSESSTESRSSHSRSRSSSRGRVHRRSKRRDKRRNRSREKRSARRRESRSPPSRSSYSKYHREPAPVAFGYYTNPLTSSGTIGMPSPTHHRIPPLLSSLTPYPSAPTVGTFGNTGSYGTFAGGGNVGYRGSRNYDDRSGRRRSPRYAVYDRGHVFTSPKSDEKRGRQRSGSREKDGGRKEREEQKQRNRESDERKRKEEKESRKAKEESDRDEKRRKKEKNSKRHEEKVVPKEEFVETPETDKPVDLIVGGSEKNVTVEEKVEEVAEISEADTVPETAVTSIKSLENDTITAEEAVFTEAATAASSLQTVQAVLGVAQVVSSGVAQDIDDDVSGAEVENDVEETAEVIPSRESAAVSLEKESEDQERSEKKKHRKRKRRHHHNDGDSNEDEEKHKRHKSDEKNDESISKKHRNKKHKRSKEEREKRREEKEKRREEKRKRRKMEKELENTKMDQHENDFDTGSIAGETEREGVCTSEKTLAIMDTSNKEALSLSEWNQTAEELNISAQKEAVKAKERADENRKETKAERDEEKKEKSVDLVKEDHGSRREKKTRREDQKDHSNDGDRKKYEVRRSKDRRERSSHKSDHKKDEKSEKQKKEERNRKDDVKESKRSDESSEHRKDSSRYRGSMKDKADTSDSKSRHRERRSEKRRSESDRDDRKRARGDENTKRSKESRNRKGRDAEESKTREKKLKGNDDEKRLPLERLAEKKSAETSGAESKGKSTVIKKSFTENADILKNQEAEKKRIDEIKVSIEKEIERKVEAGPVIDGTDKPKLTVELKNCVERPSRDTVFEGAAPHFNARQKIKMILFSESQRHAAERSKKIGASTVSK